jgi:GTP diphosphokinase / guanosine-3',5'-bis(diphosphate) 3'-diphosphatase
VDGCGFRSCNRFGTGGECKVTLEECISFASLKHQGQIYKGFDWPFEDEPYICHPLRVMLRLSQMESAYELMQIAILHDVLEDTNTTADEIKSLDLSPLVIRSILDITRNKDTEDYLSYINRIAKCHFPTRIVKMEDLRENLSRNPSHRLHVRYTEALRILSAV